MIRDFVFDNNEYAPPPRTSRPPVCGLSLKQPDQPDRQVLMKEAFNQAKKRHGKLQLDYRV